MSLAVLALLATSGGATGESVKTAKVSQVTLHRFDNRTQNFTRAAWHWDDFLGRPHIHFSYPTHCSNSLKCVKWVLKKRQAVSLRLHQAVKRVMVKRTKVLVTTAIRLRQELGLIASNRHLSADLGVEAQFNYVRRLVKALSAEWRKSGLLQDFTCIHGYEASWTADTGNGYYGGLQMDLPFQQHYGADYLKRWGTANHWPIWAQLAAAAKAYRSGRGFWPWPNTARVCGLI